MKKNKLLAFFIIFLTFNTVSYSASFFSGFAGGKISFMADPNKTVFNPYLNLQGFFEGQLNFSQNVWSRMEFSFTTSDLFTPAIFNEDSKIDSLFKMDELSLIVKNNFSNTTNYFSAYLGTYDPIGSDIFLQRYFGIESIESKLTDSWLGMSGSIIYPHFGGGISDVIRFYSVPEALGAYFYVNKDDAFILNADIRNAGVFQYFTYDLSAGIGIPVSKRDPSTNAIIYIDKLNFHAGLTMLAGNTYTSGFFLQGGFKACIDKAKSDPVLEPKNVYLILEPRVLIKNTHIHLTVFSLPELTTEKLLNIHDTFGLDLNFYTDLLLKNSKSLSFGMHTTLSLPGMTFLDVPGLFISNSMGTFIADPANYNIILTPYVSTKIYSGTAHAQLKINISSFIRSEPLKAFALDAGFKTKF